MNMLKSNSTGVWKKYLIIALLSFSWYVFWLYTNIAGTISCMSDGFDYSCFNGGGESIMWYSGSHYAPTNLAASILAPLGSINEHLAVEDISNPPIIISGIIFGFTAYWLGTKIIRRIKKHQTSNQQLD